MHQQIKQRVKKIIYKININTLEDLFIDSKLIKYLYIKDKGKRKKK